MGIEHSQRRAYVRSKQSGEAGRASSWLFLFSLLLLVPYVFLGESFLYRWIDPRGAKAVVVVGTALFAFAVAAGVRFLIVERTGGYGLERSVRSDLRDLRALVKEQQALIDRIELELRGDSAAISPHGQLCIEVAKRLIGAIRRSIIEAEELMRSGNRYSLDDAAQLLRVCPLTVEGLNRISMGGGLAPILSPVAWIRHMPYLIEEISRGIRRAA